MFLSKSTLQKKKYAIAFLLLFIFLTPYTWGNNYNFSIKNKPAHPKTKVAKTELPAPFVDTPMDSEFFAPGVGVVLISETYTYSNISPGCTYIQFTIRVFNTSTNNESLENIDISMGSDVTISFKDGDDNNNGQLDVGELWTYNGTRDILTSEIEAKSASDQAAVKADVVGQPGVIVSDLSHPSDPSLDEVTKTKLDCATGISLILTGVTTGPLGNGDPGCSSVELTYELYHTSDDPGETFESIVLNDANQGNILFPDSGDDINPGHLDPGEVWIYKVAYVPTAEEYLAGTMLVQGYVEGKTVFDSSVIVSDLSDYVSLDEDRKTAIDLSSCVPKISLIKKGVTVNGQGEEGGCSFIQYSFSVTNQSGPDQVLENISLTDINNPGLFIQGPVGDINNDGLMDPGESWSYTAVYQLTADDINAEQVENQAHVKAKLLGASIDVEDYSDYESIDEDRPTVVQLVNCARMGLIKTGVLNGDCTSIDYTFTLTNESGNDQILENVVLNDLDLALTINGPEGDANNDARLDMGETWTYTATYALTQADINAGVVDNQAMVSANVLGLPDLIIEDLSDDNSIDENDITSIDVSSCQISSPSIGLIKTGVLADVNTDGCFESIRYTFTVTNTGDVDLEDITVDDILFDGALAGPVPESDEGGDGILSVGESWTYEALYGLEQLDIDNGNVVNSAIVSALILGTNTQVQDQSDNDSLLEDDPTNTAVPNDACTDGSAGIGLIKTGTLADVNQDGCFESIRYTFTVTNTGDVDLEDITVDDILFDGALAGPVAGSDEGGDGILSVGESWTYEALYGLEQLDIDNGNVVNTAQVTAQVLGTNTQVQDQSDDDSLLEDDPTNTAVPNDACTDGSAGIGLIKTGTLADVNTDGCFESIRYTFTVTNTGDVDLEDITVDDILFDGALAGPVAGSDEGGDGILSVGESWTYEALYELEQLDIDNGNVVNTAQVTAQVLGTNTQVQDQSDNDSLLEDDPTNTAVPNDACTDGSAGIGLIKTGALADVNQDGCFESIRYTFTVTNTGDVDLEEVTINDEMLGGILAGPVADSDEGDDGILSVGESWTYEALYGLKQLDIDNGNVVNTAQVTAQILGTNTQVQDQSDNDSLLEDDPTNTAVPNDACTDGSAGIGLIKTGALVDVNTDGCFESIRYTFTVTNTGDVDLEDITVDDILFDGALAGPVAGSDEGGDGIISVGESWTYEALYGLKQLDIDNGNVVNTAQVTAQILGTNTQVQDQSDDDSLLEDDSTNTAVPNDACTDGSAGIGLIKTGALTDVNSDGCFESIRYTFTVTNTGDVDLDEVTVDDPLLGGALAGPVAGSDDGDDGILSMGESWTYGALYTLTQLDIDNGSVVNTALVTAQVLDTNIQVQDQSDNNSLLEDDPTSIMVPNDACTTGGAGIGLIKKGKLFDANYDGCDDSIRYTFTVTNGGYVDLEEITLTDDLLDGKVTGPLLGNDINGDGILSVGESWTYEDTYSLTQEDIDEGSVTNQATVMAQPIGMDFLIMDLSDDDRLFENQHTITFVPNYSCSGVNQDPDFKIFTGITPDGDGINDYFRINNIESYPDNVLKIFNRWGALVYQAEGYGLNDNYFTGISEGKATIQQKRELPSGTYFYTLSFTGQNPGEENYSGYLYINRD